MGRYPVLEKFYDSYFVARGYVLEVLILGVHTALKYCRTFTHTKKRTHYRSTETGTVNYNELYFILTFDLL